MKQAITTVLLLLLIIHYSYTQEYTQTLKGQVVDKESQVSLPGANILVQNDHDRLGTISNEAGYFRIDNIETGRVNLSVSYVGYKTLYFNNLNLTTGKEIIIKAELEEEVHEAEEVTIMASKENNRVNNQMATLSARTFSIEESQRYAGARNDVARMVANYAGVSTNNDAVNDIVIRGNSPYGLLWRLEGIDVPNPNHFGNTGATGGPVGMLNNNVLANSDFMTGAFPAEYGNAYSGVFDLKMRNGNYDKHEFLGQIGFNGFELGTEGPLPGNDHASYLVNYRYSTLGVLSKLGIDFGTGTAVPYYQDLSFKVNLPTQNAGKFTIFGLGGKSRIEFIRSEMDSSELQMGFYRDDGLDIHAKTESGSIGGSHTYIFNESTYTRVNLGVTGMLNHNIVDSVSTENREPVPFARNRFYEGTLQFNAYLNKKFNAKNNIRVGFNLQRVNFSLIDSVYSAPDNEFNSWLDSKGIINLYQLYTQWQYKMDEKLTFNTGLHYQQTDLNEDVAIEPRIGISYQTGIRSEVSFAYGLHSRMLPLFIYFSRHETGPNTYVQPNKELGFLKSHHLVAGYDYRFKYNINLKTEIYYQHLFDTPVEVKDSYYNIINNSSVFAWLPDSLANEGTGRNYGIDITLEKYMEKGLYFLMTTSLFDSKYKGSNGLEISTAFDGTYVINFLGGKEFRILKNKTSANTKKFLTFDARTTMAGGQRYTPVDLAKSVEAGQTRYDWDRSFSEKFDDYFRADFRAAFRTDGKNLSQEWAVDVQNLTNHKNPLMMQFNMQTGKADPVNQLGFFPMMQYRIMF